MPTYREPKTRNITKVFREATDAQREAGMVWYEVARMVADGMAEKFDIPLDKVAGIIAATSPLTSWGENQNIAYRMLQSQGTMETGYLYKQLDKARRIYAGEHALDVLGGDKTINFYLSILSGGQMGVCIDRHAYSIAVNHRYKEGAIPTLRGRRYQEVSDKYVRAARILSKEYGYDIAPGQVQAVTWTAWRQKFWAVGAFDGHREV